MKYCLCVCVHCRVHTRYRRRRQVKKRKYIPREALHNKNHVPDVYLLPLSVFVYVTDVCVSVPRRRFEKGGRN